ncbi:MFS transporter [Anoxybacillus kestanbolensis]|uniref:MFS transporter n=1 Tax=Anoxybacillus kestanbolensis TaxID=227476 RepID=UPI000946474D|nr:MFS transporter [Anoxybacillus kestanbolensis]MCL9971734.1 MFS transporter [Anoxybacillus kestanbolensis]
MLKICTINKKFTNLFLGTLITVLGNNIQRIAIPLFVLEQTGSSISAGVLLAVSYIPNILLFPIGGVLADRYSKVKIMIISDLISLITLVITLSILLIKFDVIYIYILTVSLSVLSSFFLPAAKSIVPFIVDEKKLGHANSLINFAITTSELIAPFLSIFLYSTFWGIEGILIINIISFAFSIYFESKIKEEISSSNTRNLSLKNKDAKKFIEFTEYKEVLCNLVNKKAIFMGTISGGLINTLMAPIVTLGYIYIVKEVLETSVYLISYVETSLVGGTVIGTILYNYFKDKKNIISTNVLIIGFSFVVIAISIMISSNILFILINLILGVSISIFNIALITEVNKKVDKVIQGKTISFIHTVSIIGVPLGNYFLGYSLEIFGILNILIFSFIVISFIGLIALLYEKREGETNVEVDC